MKATEQNTNLSEVVAELRRLEAAATPNPWRRGVPGWDEESDSDVPSMEVRGPDYVQQFYGATVSDCVCVLGFSAHKLHNANLELIAAMRNALPQLLAAAEALEMAGELLDKLDYHGDPAIAAIDAVINKALEGK